MHVESCRGAVAPSCVAIEYHTIKLVHNSNPRNMAFSKRGIKLQSEFVGFDPQSTENGVHISCLTLESLLPVLVL